MASTSVVFDILARDRASDKFDHLGRSVGSSSGMLSKFAGVAKAAGKVAILGLASGVGLAAVAGAKFAKQAVEDAQSAELLRGALERNAGATKSQVADVEDWITAIGKAKGVADDDLRPALARLVTATHDVGHAQMLAQVAMDVSAGTGKSLEAVSTALMKAQNGQVSSLSRLGINTKNAAGETISMEEAVSRMSDTFGGAASEKAETLQGKMDRLKLMLSETGEAIGYKLIPFVLAMGTFFMDNVVPALSATADWLGVHLMPKLRELGDWVQSRVIPAVQQFVHGMQDGTGAGGRFADAVGKMKDALHQAWNILKPVFEFMGNNKTVVATFAGVILTVVAAVKVWTAVQTALNIVLSANPIGLVVVAIAALAAGVVYAYKHSETFRNVVNAVGAALTGALGAIKSFGNAIVGKIGGAIDFVKSIPEKVKAAIGNLGGLLWSAGADIIQGLIDGITSKVSALTSKLSEITNLIPKFKGPEDKDKILLKPAGVAIMQGLVDGIEKGKVKLTTVLEKLTDYISKHKAKLAKLQDMKASIVDSFKGFASSIFGADTGEQAHADRLQQINELLAEQADIRQQLVDGTIDQAEAQKRLDAAQAKISGIQAEDAAQPRGLAALLAYQKQQRAKAEGLKADVGTLISKGISKDLLTQLQNAGEAGEEQIHLLATGTVDEIRQANEDNAATLQALQDAGLAAAKAQGIDAAIAQEEANIKLADKIEEKLQALLDKQDENTIVELHLDGHKILWSLKKIKKANGGHLGLGDKDPD